jgi:hypothetical protein
MKAIRLKPHALKVIGFTAEQSKRELTMEFRPGHSLRSNTFVNRQSSTRNQAYRASNQDASLLKANNNIPLSNLFSLSPSQSPLQMGNGANLNASNTNILLMMLMNILQLLAANSVQGNQRWSLGNQPQSQLPIRDAEDAPIQNEAEQVSQNNSTAIAKEVQTASDSNIGTSKAKDAQVTGTNYYVDSVNGSDANDGLSADKPLKSLNKVNQLDLKPGDGVNFAKGSTFNGELEVRNSGTQDKPIVYRSYGTGEMPVFKNSGDGWKIAVNVTGSHNVLDGLKLEDATIGVQFADGADGNTLQNSEATNVGRGVDVEGDGNDIRSNYFHDLKMVIDTAGGNDDNGANGVVIHSSNTTIENNRFERNIASSHDYGKDGGAVEIYAFKNKEINNTVIRGNTVSDSDGFIEVGADGRTAVNNTLIENNVSKNNGLFSVIHNAAMSKASDEDNAVIKNYVVQNNTITEQTTNPDDLFIDGGTIKDNQYRKLD